MYFQYFIDTAQNKSVSFSEKKKSTLTVWVVAVRVPSLTFVQPISIVNDANLSKATMSTSFDDGVADAAVEKPSGCTNMKT